MPENSTTNLTTTSRLDGAVPGIPRAEVREVETLPDRLPEGVTVGPWTWASPGCLLFEVPGIARYMVRDGNTIEVAVVPGADRDAVELFLQAYARGVLIHQRGELPLAATTVVSPGWKCVALCAPSAYGKSMLAAELCRRGWRLMADDVTRISWNGTMAVAWPSAGTLKLWQDTCEKMGIDHGALKRVRAGLAKFHLPVETMETPAALAAVVRMRMSDGAGIVTFAPEDCRALLSLSAFHPRQIDPLGMRAAHQRIVAQTAQTARALGLDGARRRDVKETADILAETIR